MDDLHLKLADWLWLLPLGLALYILHLPLLGFWRADVPALLVLLFCIYRPRGLSLFAAFAVGLLQDLVALAPLGQHAIGLAVLAYLAHSTRSWTRLQPPLKQLPMVFAGLLLVELIHSLLRFGPPPNLDALLSVLLACLLWPPLVTAVALFRRRRAV
ncbi:MAG: rod shape-determining protein MreD [Cellvibrionales bacterium]|nr:rod shape-determining protein MreD [Cellvibrionales bacterium]